jgi:hypothetical protein
VWAGEDAGGAPTGAPRGVAQAAPMLTEVPQQTQAQQQMQASQQTQAVKRAPGSARSMGSRVRPRLARVTTAARRSWPLRVHSLQAVLHSRPLSARLWVRTWL